MADIPFRYPRHVLAAFLASLAVILVPPLFVPYPPFTDLIAFIGMQSYPPRLSYGPSHYYVFQFTYFLHHVISRVFVDLGVGVKGQAYLFYALHALGYFALTVKLLCRFVSSTWMRAIGILAGSLALLDGCFLLGGPLAFSLAGVMIALSILLILEAHAEDRRPRTGVLILLAILAMASHPFAAPLLLALYFSTYMVAPLQRRPAATVAAVIAGYAFLISRDSPEPVPRAVLMQMADISFAHIWSNLKDLATWDVWYLDRLFGEKLRVLNGYVYFVAAVKTMGVVAAILLCRRFWKNRALRLLLVLEMAFFGMYLVFAEKVVPEWPYRILSVTHPVTFSFGVIALAEASTLIRWPEFLRRAAAAAWKPSTGYAALAAIGIYLSAVQVQLFARGRVLETAYRDLKSTVIHSGARDAVMTIDGLDNVEPHYLRAAHFLLFSDPDIVARNLLLFTEWHVQPRHNSRIPEVDFPPVRSRMVLRFLPARFTIKAEVVSAGRQTASPGVHSERAIMVACCDRSSP